MCKYFIRLSTKLFFHPLGANNSNHENCKNKQVYVLHDQENLIWKRHSTNVIAVVWLIKVVGIVCFFVFFCNRIPFVNSFSPCARVSNMPMQQHCSQSSFFFFFFFSILQSVGIGSRRVASCLIPWHPVATVRTERGSDGTYRS